MDRQKLDALIFAAVLAGGAWWWWSRRAAAIVPAAPAPDPFVFDLSGLDRAAGDLLGGVRDAGRSVADSVMSAIAPGAWSPPAAALPYLVAIDQAEHANGIPHNLLARLLYQESRFRADIISGATVSGAGALGIAQFMPATAAELGLDPLDAFASIDAAGAYLARLYRSLGNWRDALAAYNWGVGNVKRKGLAAAPAETRAYVSQISGDVGLA